MTTAAIATLSAACIGPELSAAAAKAKRTTTQGRGTKAILDIATEC
jgi:hypothetical protein